MDVPADNIINLQVNVDGVKLFKSSNYSMWPVLESSSSFSDTHVVGCFAGPGKPDIDIFLTQFVTELNSLSVVFQNKKLKFNVQFFICDIPAKCFITPTKGHTGYFMKSWHLIFHLKPRPLSEIKRFKATEFKLFMLYASWLVFHDHPTIKSVMKLLSLSHFILPNPDNVNNANIVNFADTVLREFVKLSSDDFGRQFLSPNVYSLIHMASMVNHRKVTLESLSAFRYESKLGIVRRSLKGSFKTLTELRNKLAKIHALTAMTINPAAEFHFIRDDTVIF